MGKERYLKGVNLEHVTTSLKWDETREVSLTRVTGLLNKPV